MTHRFLNNFLARFRKGFRKALDGALCRWGHCHDKLLWIGVVTMEDIFLNLLLPIVMSLAWLTFDIQFCPENIYLWYWTLLVVKYARLRVRENIAHCDQIKNHLQTILQASCSKQKSLPTRPTRQGDINQNHLKNERSVIFSCPEQLNSWPCHSLTHSLTDSVTFDFDITEWP